MRARCLLWTTLRGLARREHLKVAAAATAGAGAGSCRRCLGFSTAGGAPGSSSCTTTTARRGLGRGRGTFTLPQRQLAAHRAALCRLLNFADRDEVRPLFGELAPVSWPLSRLVLLLESGVVRPPDLHQVPVLLLAPVTREGGLKGVEFGCLMLCHFFSEARHDDKYAHDNKYAAVMLYFDCNKWRRGEKTPQNFSRETTGPFRTIVR